MLTRGSESGILTKPPRRGAGNLPDARLGSSLKIEQRDKDSTAKAVRSAQRKTPKILLNFLRKSSFKVIERKTNSDV